MLQAGQLRGQHLVGFHQLRQLPGLRRDLLVLRGDLSSLTVHNNDQLIARHLLQPGHRKIKAQPNRSHRDHHTDTPKATSPTAHRRAGAGLNAYLGSATIFA
ncbi:MAG: hypothetical protein ACRDRE_23450 [Pseudonocardiaceae bacterium]